MSKNWCFQLWCYRRLLRVPWTARRSNQSILREINPEYSLGGLTLKLKLQYFGDLIYGHQPTHWKRPWCWNTPWTRLKAKGEEGGRGWDGWITPPIQWKWTWVNSGRHPRDFTLLISVSLNHFDATSVAKPDTGEPYFQGSFIILHHKFHCPLNKHSFICNFPLV